MSEIERDNKVNDGTDRIYQQRVDSWSRDPAILHDKLKLQAIVESKLFQSLDCQYQVALLGEDTIRLYETMIQPISETPYYFHCNEYW